MSVYGSIMPGVSCLMNSPVGLSEKVRQRLKWFDYYHSYGHDARLTCHYFGIFPQTCYRWKKHYNPPRLEALGNRYSRPECLHQPITPLELVLAVQRLREQYPRWDKDKLVMRVCRAGS